jgi:hypothetical protein
MWPWSTIATLRRELDEKRQYIAQLDKLADDNFIALRSAKVDFEQHGNLIDAMREEIATLLAELAQARKNDTPKDAKGRFTKKAKNV